MLHSSLEESLYSVLFQSPVLAVVVEFVLLGFLPIPLWLLVHQKAGCFVLENHGVTRCTSDFYQNMST